MGEYNEFIVYKTAIEASIKTQFPTLNGQSIDVRVFEKFALSELKKPAIIFGLPLMTPSPVKNDEEFWLRINNSAYIITSVTLDATSIFCQQLSTNLGNFIEGNNWNGAANTASGITISPDSMAGLENCNIQRIDFIQDLQIIDKN